MIKAGQSFLYWVQNPVVMTTIADYEGAERFIWEKLHRELPSNLPYHNIEHIGDVFNSAMNIAAHERVTPEEVRLIRIAALFHDSGLTVTHKQHEEKGCEIAMEVLPSFGFTQDQLQLICGMIMATMVPQTPHTLLERILCDADLDYLGRDDFHTTGEKLHSELREIGAVKTDREWDLIQKAFLENHEYHTAYSKANREDVKQKHLKEVIARLKK